jgi:hypothetical protein
MSACPLDPVWLRPDPVWELRVRACVRVCAAVCQRWPPQGARRNAVVGSAGARPQRRGGVRGHRGRGMAMAQWYKGSAFGLAGARACVSGILASQGRGTTPARWKGGAPAGSWPKLDPLVG